MMRLRNKLMVRLLAVFDALAMLTALAISTGAFQAPGGGLSLELLRRSYTLAEIGAVSFLVLGWAGIQWALVRYDPERFRPLMAEVGDVLKAVVGGTLWLALAAALFGLPGITPLAVLSFCGMAGALCILGRVLLRALLISGRKCVGKSRQLLIVGHNPHALRLAARIEAHPELGCQLAGFVRSEKEPELTSSAAGAVGGEGNWGVVGTLKDLKSILSRTVVDEIMVCLRLEDSVGQLSEILRVGRQAGVVVRVAPESFDSMLLQSMRFEFLDDCPVMTLFRERQVLQVMLKRATDITVSLFLLTALMPLLIAVGLAVRATSPGPALFVQERVGRNQRRFRMYKFRSMVADAEARKDQLGHLNEMDGPVFKIKRDPRITPLGRFLRRTSLDELPQLFNVLKGEMSLVGPRPPLPSEVEKYEWACRKRLSTKPGLTCLWQVGGRNEVSFTRWMELDRQYIENWSLMLDYKILLKTIPVVLLRKGAS